jgi:hypothetical protein
LGCAQEREKEGVVSARKGQKRVCVVRRIGQKKAWIARKKDVKRGLGLSALSRIPGLARIASASRQSAMGGPEGGVSSNLRVEGLDEYAAKGRGRAPWLIPRGWGEEKGYEWGWAVNGDGL